MWFIFVVGAITLATSLSVNALARARIGSRRGRAPEGGE